MPIVKIEDTVPGASDEEARYLFTIKSEFLLRHAPEISKYQLDIYKRGARVSPKIRDGVFNYYRHQLEILKKILGEE